MAAFVAATAWPRGSAGAAKVPRVGIIDDGSDWGAFRQELHELNYVEGQNIAFEYRQVDGTPDRLAAAARELAQIPVDVIVVYGTPAGQAAQQATKSIPIVVVAVGDMSAAGLVTNFAHPGGNITGNTALGPDIVTKRLQVLRDAIPTVSRVALLWNPNNASSAAILDEFWKTTPYFGMSLTPVEARTADDFPQAFAAMLSNRPDAVLTSNDAMHQSHTQESNSGPIHAPAQCRRRRADVLRHEHAGPVSPRRPLCGQNSSRHQTRRASDRAAAFVRTRR
jgi:putative ABC transport system substrate-binding protein